MCAKTHQKFQPFYQFFALILQILHDKNSLSSASKQHEFRISSNSFFNGLRNILWVERSGNLVVQPCSFFLPPRVSPAETSVPPSPCCFARLQAAETRVMHHCACNRAACGQAGPNVVVLSFLVSSPFLPHLRLRSSTEHTPRRP